MYMCEVCGGRRRLLFPGQNNRYTSTHRLYTRNFDENERLLVELMYVYASFWHSVAKEK